MSTARQMFSSVVPHGQDGVVSDSVFDAGLDLAERVLEHFGPLVARYVADWSSPNVPRELGAVYQGVTNQMIEYGVFLHFIGYVSDTRKHFGRLDSSDLDEQWRATAAASISFFRQYSEANGNVPAAIFARLYQNDVEAAVKKSGVWAWKRERFKSTVLDRFATGVVLGQVIDEATARLGSPDPST